MTIEKKEVKLSTNWKPIKPTNPNQTENQWGRPPIWIDEWTDEVVIDELNTMLSELTKKKEYIYIWELFEGKPYSRSSFIQQVSNRKDNQKIAQVYNTIKDILETRAVSWAMWGWLNATFTTFHLKNNYWWVDKQVNENTNTNLNLEVEDSGEMKDLLSDNWLI